MTVTAGRLTVISSVKNAADSLEQTIASVAGQEYRDLEYIVVDGGSTDGTADLAAAHKATVSRFVCEPDDGVYFGMNRGVELANGEWIVFLNAGDSFCDGGVVTQVMSTLSPGLDIVYGDHFFGDESRPRRALPFEVLWERMKKGTLDEAWIVGFPCHQAVFAKRELLLELRYDTRYRHAAEQEFLFRAFAGGKRIGKIDITVCRYAAGGMSHRNQIAMLLEKRAILRKYGGGPAVGRFFAGRILNVLKRRLRERFFSK